MTNPDALAKKHLTPTPCVQHPKLCKHAIPQPNHCHTPRPLFDDDAQPSHTSLNTSHECCTQNPTEVPATSKARGRAKSLKPKCDGHISEIRSEGKDIKDGRRPVVLDRRAAGSREQGWLQVLLHTCSGTTLQHWRSRRFKGCFSGAGGRAHGEAASEGGHEARRGGEGAWR